jgi:hypothetical protein
MTADRPPRPRTPTRVCLLGATGTIGRATLCTLIRRGHEVVCFARPGPGGALAVDGRKIRLVDVGDPVSIARDGFRGGRFNAVVSCMASLRSALIPPGDREAAAGQGRGHGPRERSDRPLWRGSRQRYRRPPPLLASLLSSLVRTRVPSALLLTLVIPSGLPLAGGS